MLNMVLNLIFPRLCFGCQKRGKYLCNSCLREKVYVNWIQKCHVCSSETRLGLVHKECLERTYIDGLIWICLYEGVVERLLKDVKYSLVSDILNEISQIMCKFLRYYNINRDLLIIAVPIHKNKLKNRGFNQAGILAKLVAKSLNLEFYDVLVRVRKTKTQVGLSQMEREINLKNAFVIMPKYMHLIKDRSILIVDDVYTTGSTLNECAKVLKESGAKEVIGFTFAKSRI
jgi:competence protein ComFC